MRRIIAGLVLCAVTVAGCGPGSGGSSVPAAHSAAGGFAAPQGIARAIPPAPPNFVPAFPNSVTRRTSGLATSSAALAPFFAGAASLGGGAFYLAFPNHNVFGYYSYLSDPNYIYHFEMGYEYVYDAGDGQAGVFLYDFASGHWWYTSPGYGFPYLYDFSLSAVLYYYPNANSAGHYTTNPRWFHNFGTGSDLQLPAPAPSARAIERAAVQATLTVSKVIDSGGYYVGGPALGPMGRGGRHPLGLRHAQSAVCSPGGANGDGSASFTSVIDSQGIDHEIYTDYYGPGCVGQVERLATLDYPSTVSGAASGSTTEYDRAGAVIGFSTHQQTYSMTQTTTQLTVQTADAKTVGGAVVGRNGVTCMSTQSGSVDRCSIASSMTAAGETTGLVETITETLNSDGTSWGAQISGTTYGGSGLALVPPAPGGADWGIQGGVPVDTLGGNGTAVYGGSYATELAYAVTFGPDAFSAAASYVLIPQTLTIRIARSGTGVATAVVDGDGNGVVTYASDNATDTVAGFTIFR